MSIGKQPKRIVWILVQAANFSKRPDEDRTKVLCVPQYSISLCVNDTAANENAPRLDNKSTRCSRMLPGDAISDLELGQGWVAAEGDNTVGVE